MSQSSCIAIDLSGKVAVVTGAGGQLGRVMARTLARAGADVAVHYLNSAEVAERLVAEIKDLGRRAVAVKADIGDHGDVFAMRDTIAASLGAPDIIVNNAVSQYAWTSILEQADEDYESQFRSCVMQNVLMAKAFVPAMIEKGWGRIIATSTECAMQNAPSQSAYVAGKRGMDGVLRVLAREIGEHQITVNQVAPGWTISDRSRDERSESQPGYEAGVPLRRRGTDQEIANVVVFLASDLASYVTGVYIPVCGGNVMPAI
jgi:3-oxoacyl-[acyl-carrier protein] reductase